MVRLFPRERVQQGEETDAGDVGPRKERVQCIDKANGRGVLQQDGVLDSKA